MEQQWGELHFSSSRDRPQASPRAPWLSALVWLVALSGVFLLSSQRAAGSPRLAKFEPARGCYLGAHLRPVGIGADIRRFEAMTGRKHASYFRYVGYGRPFPTEWVEHVKSLGAVPHIAFEPNRGLQEVQDGPYLRRWARAARAAGCPIFLRWASEMNGHWTAYHAPASLYIEKFRLIHRVMTQEAPNVAMVWTVFYYHRRGGPMRFRAWYPGDAYVDWVGVNIYSVCHYSGSLRLKGRETDCIRALSDFYREYAARKPVQISEFGATHFCQVEGKPRPEFAIQTMTLFYRSLEKRFPRVKMVNLFNVNTIKAGLARNDYSVTSDPKVLNTYRWLIQDPYFLSDVPWPSDLCPGDAGTSGALSTAR